MSLAILPSGTFTLDVDHRADVCVCPDGRYIRREIIVYREGPRGAWIPDNDGHPGAHQSYAVPLHTVVYVREDVPLDQPNADRAIKAAWPCNCGCMA